MGIFWIRDQIIQHVTSQLVDGKTGFILLEFHQPENKTLVVKGV
jgi:hypothetical protein